jgi:hypothetical protein
VGSTGARRVGDSTGCGSYYCALAKPRPILVRDRTPRTPARAEPQGLGEGGPAARGGRDLTGLLAEFLPYTEDIHRVKVTTHTSLMNGRDFLI